MAFEHKPNSGTLFDNSKGVAKNSRAPHMTGTALIGGVNGRLSLWWNDHPKLGTIGGLKFTPEDEIPGRSAPASGNLPGQQAAAAHKTDDDIPF